MTGSETLIARPYTLQGDNFADASGQSIVMFRLTCLWIDHERVDPIHRTDHRPADNAELAVVGEYHHAVSALAHRRFGGDCYSFGLLAAGHIDLVIDAGLQPYDYLSLVPVIEGAGGVITDWSGQPLSTLSDGRVVASATKELHAVTLSALATPEAG